MRLARPCTALGVTVVLLGVLAGCPMGTLGIPGEFDFRVLGWRYGFSDVDYGHTIDETPGGGYFTVGQTAPLQGMLQNLEVICLKVSASGALEWHRIVEGLHPQSGSGPRAQGVLACDSGAVLAGLTAAQSHPTDYDGRLRIVRLNPSGETIWDRAYHPEQQWIPQGIARATDGGIVVSLLEGGLFTTGAERLMKADGQGNVVWDVPLETTRTYKRLEDLKATSDGGYVLAGHSLAPGTGSGRYDVSIAKTDSHGNVQWWRHYDIPGSQQGFAVDIAPDGGYVVAGTSGPEPYAIRTDSNGNLLWARDDIIDVDVTDPSSPDYEVWDVAVTPDGCIGIAGLGESVTYHGVPFPEIVRGGFILELDPNGNLKWYTQFDERQVSQIYGIAVTSDGNYVTTGVSAYAEIQVLKIDRSGNVLN